MYLTAAIVLMLTLLRAITFNRSTKGGVQSLINLIVRDGTVKASCIRYNRFQLYSGVIYFVVIFVADLVNVLTFLVRDVWYREPINQY